MTIHRSKGLQFPVVFLADTARKFNAADLREPVLLHRVYGAGLRLRQEAGSCTRPPPTPPWGRSMSGKCAGEQMRLLYVALTRAQDRLIVTLPLGITRTRTPWKRPPPSWRPGRGRCCTASAIPLRGGSGPLCWSTPTAGPLRRLAGGSGTALCEHRQRPSP